MVSPCAIAVVVNDEGQVGGIQWRYFLRNGIALNRTKTEPFSYNISGRVFAAQLNI